MEHEKRGTRREKIRSISIGAVILLTILSLYGNAAEPTNLWVRQAYAELPRIIAYVDILDSSGNRVEGITRGQISAAVRQYETNVTDLQPFAATGEGTAYIILVDISKTLTENEFKQIREALTLWIENMKAADWMSIIAFGDTCDVAANFINDKQKLKETVKRLAPKGMNTRLYEALKQAVENHIQRKDPGLPTRRVIVVLSDGKNEGGGGTEADIKDMLKQNPLPVYSIGYSRLRPGEREKFLNVLESFSNDTGGIFVEAKANKLREMYDTIQKAILRVYRLELRCDSFPGDGQMHRLQVELNSGSIRLSNGIDVRINKKKEPISKVVTGKNGKKNEETGALPMWLYPIGAGVILLAAILGFVITRKKRKALEDKKSEIPSAVGEREQVEPPVVGISAKGKPKTGGINIRLVEIGGKGKAGDYGFILSERAVIGRDPTCDAVLANDMDISREHCELLLENDSVLIRDLGTTNGTMVNGVPITGRYRLESGDKILVGRTELRILFEKG
jgi:VWFA-related protein